MVKHHKIVQLQVTYDEAMDEASVTDPSNYSLQAETAKNFGDGGTGGSVSVRRADYNPATQTVSLVPAKPLKTGVVYDLNFNSYWVTNTTATGIEDPPGNPLNTTDIEIGVGHTLRYATLPAAEMGGQFYKESIKLSGPGTMIADNGMLYLVGTNSGKSVLTGTNSPISVNSESWTVVSPNGVIDHSHSTY